MKFEKDYFIDSSTSNYRNYPKKIFRNQVEELVNYFGLKKSDRILDYGCACGGLLKEFKERGFRNIKGTDISHWAIDFGKRNFELENELEYYNRNLLSENMDYIFFLDVLEHIPLFETMFLLEILQKSPPSKYILVRVPVTRREGDDYFLDVSKNDKTHIQRHNKKWWIKLFEKYNFKLTDKPHLSSIYDSMGVFVGVFRYEDKYTRSNEEQGRGTLWTSDVLVTSVA